MVTSHGQITEEPVADQFQVVLFLWQLRQAASKRFRFERRPENRATLAELGVTEADAKSRILRMTPQDYYRGPTKRPDRLDQESWEFGIMVRGIEVYVKMEVRLEPSVCVVVSFHRPARPLTYPLRKS